MGLQMTGCKQAPTHSTQKLTTVVRKSQNTKALFTLPGGFCDPPGLRKAVAGAHSHSGKTVDHLLNRRLVGKVEHDRRCTGGEEMMSLTSPGDEEVLLRELEVQ